jgi:hypothetical protein
MIQDALAGSATWLLQRKNRRLSFRRVTERLAELCSGSLFAIKLLGLIGSGGRI